MKKPERRILWILLLIIFLFCGSFLNTIVKNPSTDYSVPSTIVPPSVLRLATVPGSSDPSEDEWPMFHGQLNHTGETNTPPISSASPFWTYTTGYDVSSSPAVVGGRVYVGSDDRNLYCLNATTGGLLWNYTTGDCVHSSPAVADGCVYVGSLDKKIYCFNATSGQCLWSYPTGAWVWSSPAVADGRVYVASEDHLVYCLMATTGQCLWSYPTGASVWSSPAVADGRVYVASEDHRVYCLTAITGSQLWNSTIGNTVQSSPAVAGDRVYVGCDDHLVYCLNATTGRQLWNYTTGDQVISSPAVAGGRVYVGSLDYRLYCLNATTGGLLWNYLTNHMVISSPAVANGRVYVGGLYIYCLNATTGEYRWIFATEFSESSPAVTNGRVYIGNDNNKIYCLPMDTPSLSYTFVNESAELLELGSTETITIFGVTGGLTSISSVYLTYEGSDHYMTNLGGGSWNYNMWTPSNLTTYPYTITIWEYGGHTLTIPGSIQVVDTTPPTYSSVIENDPVELGGNLLITIANVKDLSGIKIVLIEFEGSNYTMTDQGFGFWTYDAGILSRGMYSYMIYIQDNANLWNSTNAGSIQVVDTIPPWYSSLEYSGASITITLHDYSGIKTVLLEFEGNNHTMTDLGNDDWYYGKWAPDSAVNYSFSIYFQDNAENWGVYNGWFMGAGSGIPAFTMPLLTIVILTIAGIFILKRRTNL